MKLKGVQGRVQQRRHSIEERPKPSVACSWGLWAAREAARFGVTVTTALTDGVYNITAKATDVAGNVSPASAAFTFTLDTTPGSLILAWDPEGQTDNWTDAGAWVDISTGQHRNWNDGSKVIFRGDGGTITVDSDVSASMLIFQTDGHTLSGTGSLTLTGGGAAIAATGSVTVNSPIVIGASQQWSVSWGKTLSVAGVISGSSSLTKTGMGVLILSGANTYPGETMISHGELSVTGSIVSSAVSIGNGTLSGTGSTGAVTATSGTVSPGVGGVGTLNTGNLAFATGSQYDVDLTDSGYDQVNVTGTVNLGDASLNVTSTRVDVGDDVLVLIQNDGTDSITGTFLNLSEGDVVDAGPATYWITYCYNAEMGEFGTGNDVALISTRPAAPTGLHVAVVSGGEMDLQWTDNSANESGYSIQQQLSDSTWQEIQTADADATSQTITGRFDPSTDYTFRVTAYTDWSESPPSNLFTVHTAAWPVAPSNLTALVVSGTEIDLSWSASASATGYTVEALADGSDTWSVLGTVPASQTPTYHATGLTAGGAGYSFEVIATNAAGSSASSDSIFVQTLDLAPTVATPASAAYPVTTTNTTLSALGADDGGEANLTYAWSIVSAPSDGDAWFSTNDSNDAKNTTVTFTARGSYTFCVTISDAGGQTVTSQVSVNVDQTLSSIVLTPDAAAVLYGTSRQFTATGFDQFDKQMTPPPSFTWSVDSGVGTIDTSSGLYTAPDNGNVDATATISASAESVTQTADVAVKVGGANRYQVQTGISYQDISQDPEDYPVTSTFNVTNTNWITAGSPRDAIDQVVTGMATQSGDWDPSDEATVAQLSFGNQTYDPATGLYTVTLNFMDDSGYGVVRACTFTVKKKDVLLDLTVTDHADPTNHATAITDAAIRDLYIGGDASDTAEVDIGAMFDPMTFGTDGAGKYVHLTVKRSDGLVVADQTLSAASTLADLALQAADGANDFTVTAWLDANQNGQLDSGEDKREVDVHVANVNIRTDHNHDGVVDSTDDALNLLEPTPIYCEGYGPRTEVDLRAGFDVPAGGENVILRNIPGLEFWTAATGGTQIMPDSNGYIVDASLASLGEYTGSVFCSVDPRGPATTDWYTLLNNAALKAGIAAGQAASEALKMAQAPVAAVPHYSVLPTPIGTFKVASALVKAEKIKGVRNPFNTETPWGYTVVYTLPNTGLPAGMAGGTIILVQALDGPGRAAGAHLDIDEGKTNYDHRILPVYPGQHPAGPATLGDRPYGGDRLGKDWSITVAADYQVRNPTTGIYQDTILGCVSIKWNDALNAARLTVPAANGWSIAETDTPSLRSVNVPAAAPDKLWNDARAKW